MEENRVWRARWIWSEGLPRTSVAEHEIVYFRRTFDVPLEGCSLTVDVSADSRYRLFLNGESVAVGPCKGDGLTHYYETVDLGSKLRPGKNVLAAKVVHFRKAEPWEAGRGGPIMVWRSGSGAFFLEGALKDGDGEEIERLDSDERWRCLNDTAVRITHGHLTWWLSVLEDVRGEELPHGWERPTYDDGHWPFAVPFFSTANNYGELTPWQLTPRPIPPLYEVPKAFATVMRAGDDPPGNDRYPHAPGNENARKTAEPLLAGGTIRVPAHSHFWAELDAGYLTTGYLSFATVGGKGSVVRILCSECYEDPPENGRRSKGVRDQPDGKVLVGERDVYRVAGAGRAWDEPERYEPFWFRTFRFVRLEIETSDHPIEIGNFHFRETGYPLDVQATFESSDEDFGPLWRISLNTLKRCMHETYEDCPYYEQLQYAMDTRLQMLYTYQVSADDRMARRTIHDFHSSMLPSGMLQCRYPSNYRQVIPGFSLYWIMMIDDHYRYFGDLELVRRYRPTMLAVLDWFERRITPDGIVGETPRAYWTHIDWVQEWSRTGGAPPARLKGPITMHSLMYAYALEIAANLLVATDWYDAARELNERAGRVNQAVAKHCWSEERRLFQDGPGVDEFSQHPQVWSVLSGAVGAAQGRDLLYRTVTDRTLPVLSLPMTHFLFRAYEKVDRYDLAFGQWDRWRNLLGLGLTTTPEIAHGSPRSDCHAWSALLLGELPHGILGVRPGEPGYRRIAVSPHPGPLAWARGTVATRKGPVSVQWRRNQDGEFALEGRAPQGIPVDVTLPDGSRWTFAEGGPFQARSKR